MKLLLPILFLLLSFSTYTQEDKVHYSLDAEFVYGNNELDSFIIDNFVRPRECMENGVDFDIWMEFTVDSISHISFVRIMDIKTTHGGWTDTFNQIIQDTIKPKVKAEAIRVIKETAGFWIPKELAGTPTWQIVECKIELRTNEFFLDRREVINGSNYSHIPLDTPYDNPLKYYNLGIKKMSQKKHYIAIKYFEKSIRMGNKTKDVYYNKGVAEYLYGLKEAACKSWSEAVNLGDIEAQGLIDKNCK